MGKCKVTMKELTLEEIGEMQLSMQKAISKGKSDRAISSESNATAFECALKGSKVFLKSRGLLEE